MVCLMLKDGRGLGGGGGCLRGECALTLPLVSLLGDNC